MIESIMSCALGFVAASLIALLIVPAVNARADAIITANTQDFLPAAGTFGGEVIRPGEFLRRLHS